MPQILWLLIVDVIIVAPITAWLANEKGRSPTLWFVVAAIGGPIALLAVGLGPTRWDVEEAHRRVRRCPSCEAGVSLVATRCHACGADLPPADTEPAPVPASELEHQPQLAFEPQAEPTPAAPTNLDEPTPEPVIVTTVGRRITAAVENPNGDGGVHPEPKRARRGARTIATGVFAGGSGDMIVGYRYMISLTEKQLQLSGPVDVAPQRVVFRAARASVEAAALDSDLVIGAETSSGNRVQLSFRGVAGGKGDDLVALLDQVPHVETEPKVVRRRPRTRVG